MVGSNDGIAIGARLRETAAELGDAVAVRSIRGLDDYREASWADLEDQSNQIAALLCGAKVQDAPATVVILTRDAVDHAVFAYGAWKAGQSILCLAPNMGEREGKIVLSRLGRTISLGEVVPWDTSERLDSAMPVDSSTVDELVESDVAPDPMMIIATGGSTGVPKLVDVLGEGRFVPGNFLGGLGSAMQRTPRAKTFVCTPLSHGAGAASSYMNMFEQCEVSCLERFDAGVALWAIEKFQLEKISVVPTMMERMIRHSEFKPERLTSIQSLGHTGSKIDPKVKMAWMDAVGAEKVVEIWGSTESVGHAVIRGDEWLKHPGSVGRPINCDVRILDDDGDDVPIGDVGEIFVRPKVASVDHSKKYIGTDQRMKARGDFVSFGDLGYLDAEGYLYVAGRTDDLIITGGANVYPDEVEIAIRQLSGVADCVVVAKPHDDLGQSVHAVVALEKGADSMTLEDLRGALKKSLTGYKIPRSLEIVQEIPRSDAGKIRRKSYRERGEQ